jgi:hypothetical protein
MIRAAYPNRSRVKHDKHSAAALLVVNAPTSDLGD